MRSPRVHVPSTADARAVDVGCSTREWLRVVQVVERHIGEGWLGAEALSPRASQTLGLDVLLDPALLLSLDELGNALDERDSVSAVQAEVRAREAS